MNSYYLTKKNNSFTDSKGIILGQTYDARYKKIKKNNLYISSYKLIKKGDYIIDNSNESILVVGPPRSGKTSAITIPSLFFWPESVVVIDPHNEHFYNTGSWRKRFSDIIKLDCSDINCLNDFNPVKLIYGSAPLSLYLSINPIDMPRIRNQVNEFLLTLINNIILLKLDLENEINLNRANHRVVFIIDEAIYFTDLVFSLSEKYSLSDYGIKLMLITQKLYDYSFEKYKEFYKLFKYYLFFTSHDLQNAYKLNEFILNKLTVDELYTLPYTDFILFEKPDNNLFIGKKIMYYLDKQFSKYIFK